MRLYVRECHRIATSMIYFLFIAVMVFSWFLNFKGVTSTEIDWANGIRPADIGFDRALLSRPSPDDESFGSRTSEDHPEAIMTGVTRALLAEYKSNSYATYPIGYYKAITLNDIQQNRVLEILCEITGLTEKQLEDLPDDYFPAVTGTIISFDTMTVDENGDLTTKMENSEETDALEDKSRHFISQVTYDRFKELMQEMEKIIGENGSKYSKEMMIAYFGMSEMTYEQACAEYNLTIEKDMVTGGFARLFCDHMGLVLGFYPVFIVVMIWFSDRTGNTSQLIYCRKISTFKLILSRYFAVITMVLIPVILLSFESLIPLLSFGADKGIPIDGLAYIRYILWLLLPTVMAVSATGMFFTLLTDSPIAVALQFLWWMIDKGMTGLTGDTSIATLMIRHNTLRGYEIIQEDFAVICMNRLLFVMFGMMLVILFVWILEQKRKGIINVSNIYGRCSETIQN